MQHITHLRSKIDEVLYGKEKNLYQMNKQKVDLFFDEYGLRGREQDILRLLIDGLVHKEIAYKLNLSQRAVKYHISKIYKKCGVENKYDLFNKFKR